MLESQGDGAKKVWAHVHAAKTAARKASAVTSTLSGQRIVAGPSQKLHVRRGAAKTTGACADIESKAESTAWLEHTVTPAVPGRENFT